jgi:hypothetical protein
VVKPANDDIPMFDARRGLRRDAHPSRSFVSATRVYDALQRRFGCAPTGDGGTACTFWQTPTGRSFTVEDPIYDPACAPVLRANGKRALFYSYQYANALLRRVNELCRTAPAPRMVLDESDLRLTARPPAAS